MQNYKSTTFTYSQKSFLLEWIQAGILGMKSWTKMTGQYMTLISDIFVSRALAISADVMCTKPVLE